MQKKSPENLEFKGTKAIKSLPRATSMGPLSCTATTIRPTSRSISICSHRKVIIAKRKESRQEHTQQRKGEPE